MRTCMRFGWWARTETENWESKTVSLHRRVLPHYTRLDVVRRLGPGLSYARAIAFAGRTDCDRAVMTGWKVFNDPEVQSDEARQDAMVKYSPKPRHHRKVYMSEM